MNLLAQQLNLKNSNFVNPHGLSCKMNRSCALDVGILSKMVIRNDILKEIVKKKSYKVLITDENVKVYLKGVSKENGMGKH